MPVPIALSWSGGKDSALALSALRADPRYELVALMTSVTREYDRVSIHGVRRTLLDAQVRAIGVPLVEVSLGARASNDSYERAFHQALQSLQAVHRHVRHLAFGDLFLEDVRAYRERLLEGTGVGAEFPLWGRDTRVLAETFIAQGFEARLTCVDTTQIDGAFAGRRFDAALIADLPAGADPCGERGEFHTFVSAGPIFAAPIPVTVGEVVLRDGRFAYCDLLPVAAAGSGPS
jgi:uncharacterized protein (TIGR00290 family)